MKKIISFDKEITFPTMIKDITSISLDHTLKFTSKSTIEGEFIISGTYKMTEASRLEEDFNYKIPVDITTSESYCLETSKVEIDDFYYEVVDEEVLKVKIDVMIEGVEEVILESEIETIEEEPKEIEVRECDGDNKKEVIISKEETLELDKEEITTKEEIETKETINSLFSSFRDEDETFSTYSVYIMRKNDSLEGVLDKYNITREELSDYNELDDITIGSKLIIPSCNE